MQKTYSKSPRPVKRYAAYIIRKGRIIVHVRTDPSGAIAILKTLESIAQKERQ